MRALSFLLALIISPPILASGGDWPTFMRDNARSGRGAESLPAGLFEHWVWRSAKKPTPAWPLPQAGWTELPRVDFDDAFHVVADAERIYFGSSVDDQVHALSAKTGKTLWRFFTGGPVRLAPVLFDDRICFGSDDGHVYCLKKDDGSLLWKFDAGLSDRRVLGNGRSISPWAVRTGLVIDAGVLYFGAGVFPYHKTFAYALHADSGKLIWKNDAINNFGGFSPQGYPLLTKDRIWMPSGRAAPVCLDRDTGHFLFSAPAPTDRGGVAGVYGILIDDVLHTGTQNNLFGVRTDTGTGTGKWAAADKMLATDRDYFFLKGTAAGAYGRNAPSGAANDITCFDRPLLAKLGKRDADSLKKAKRWRLPFPDAASMILAGDQLIVGGKQRVAQVDVETGKISWEAKVEGNAVGLAVAHGRLLVSTDEGTVHSFDARSKPVLEVTQRVKVAPKIPAAVAAYLGQMTETKGYAIAIGADADEIAQGLAERTEMQVLHAATDMDGARKSRERFASLEFYGHRITAAVGALDKLPFPDLAANLIIASDPVDWTEATQREIARVLRPCGGVFLAKTGPKPFDAAAKKAWREQGICIDVDETEGWIKFLRKDLPGSGWWTHQYADAGNSGSSGDKLVKGRLDVLWFGEPGPGEFPDRHQRGAAPLVYNGRVFCEGWNQLQRKHTVFCFDAYNGIRYWTREIEGAVRLDMPAVAGNFACDGDSVYIAGGSKCHRLDAVTGEIRAVYEVPSGSAGVSSTWGYLGLADGLVFGSSNVEGKNRFSDRVFAFDVATGKLKWEHKAKEMRDTTFVYHQGRLMFVENRKPAPPPEKKNSLSKVNELLSGPKDVNMVRHVVALSGSTGKLAWEKEIDLTDCGRWEHGMWGSLQALCKDDVLVLAGAYTIYPSRVPETRPRKAVGISVRDGLLLWSEVVANKSRPIAMHDSLLAEPSFLDIQTGQKILKKQGTKMLPWTSGPRTGGCGSLSASDCMIFGRGGYTIWRDVEKGSTSAFVGMRPGCMINIIPAGGVVVQAEASSGCTCYQAVQCTIVFRPRD